MASNFNSGFVVFFFAVRFVYRRVVIESGVFVDFCSSGVSGAGFFFFHFSVRSMRLSFVFLALSLSAEFTVC